MRYFLYAVVGGLPILCIWALLSDYHQRFGKRTLAPAPPLPLTLHAPRLILAICALGVVFFMGIAVFSSPLVMPSTPPDYSLTIFFLAVDFLFGFLTWLGFRKRMVIATFSPEGIDCPLKPFIPWNEIEKMELSYDGIPPSQLTSAILLVAATRGVGTVQVPVMMMRLKHPEQFFAHGLLGAMEHVTKVFYDSPYHVYLPLYAKEGDTETLASWIQHYWQQYGGEQAA